MFKFQPEVMKENEAVVLAQDKNRGGDPLLYYPIQMLPTYVLQLLLMLPPRKLNSGSSGQLYVPNYPP